MTVRGWLGRWTDQGGGGGGDGTVGEPELRGLGAVGEPTAWTVGGAVGKPAPFGARSCKVGVGTGGEPELRGLGAEGKPTTLTVGGAIGKPAPFCARCCEDGGGTVGEPELRKLGAGGEPTAKGGLPILGAEACGEDGDGDDGGDEPSPSTCSKMAYSTGEAGDATFRFFLALVIIGEMTGLLREGSKCASAGPSPEVVAAATLGAATAEPLAERACCCCSCMGSCCSSCDSSCCC